jgi:hypothetical protein
MFIRATGNYTPARVQRIWFRFIYYAVCLIASIMVFSMFLHVRINGKSAVLFGDMIYGKAWKPWAYRALVPLCVRITAAAIPNDVSSTLNRKVWDNRIFTRFNQRWKWEQIYITEYLIACVFMYLALAGFFFAARYLFITIYEAPAQLLDFTSLVALLGLPVMFNYYSYIYDFPHLFLFTVCLALMLRNKWPLFFLIYTLTCLNKETAILLTLLCALHFRRGVPLPSGNKHLLIRILAAQIGIYSIVRIILSHFFHDNPGNFVGINLLKHNLSLSPYTLGNAAGYLLISVAILYKWEEKPPFLKSGLWMSLPLVFLCLIYGWIDELRDYYEIYPIIILLMAHTIGDIVQWKAVPRLQPNR